MAIYRMLGDKEDLAQVPVTSFGQTGVLERQDLQRILRDKPEILEDGLFVIAEECSNWQGSGRSIDLLALDQTGRLVVVELKRGETGEHMDLQAIRYAAMVSPMTQRQAIDAHQAYLNKRGRDEDAEERVNGHLENLDDSQGFSADQPRIILVSEGFSPELTTCVLWLNRNGLDITCIRMQPYRNELELLVETSQVIPLPEAADYLVRIREKEDEQRRGHRAEPDQIILGGDAFKQSIEQAPEHSQEELQRLYEWAISLEKAGLANLKTTFSSTQTTLGLAVPGDKSDARLLMIVYNSTSAFIWLFNSVLRRLAPHKARLVQELKDAISLPEKASKLREVSAEMLDALTAAYREANGLVGDDGDGG